MKRSISLPAPAKLNLFLHITGRRPDGYHNLQTVFQLIDFSDKLNIAVIEKDEIRLATKTAAIQNQDNLVWQAASALKAYTGCDRGAQIELIKTIPMGGGLGGGSSDAATTLLALNQLWDINLTIEELIPLGQQLGADVPVFLAGSSLWAEGTGERFSPITLENKWYLIIHPNCHVDTAKIFQHKQLTRDSDAIRIPAFLAEATKNDCEEVVKKLYPEVDQALKLLTEFGAHPRMTGTGACVFSTFECREDAETALKAVTNGNRAFIAKGLKHSPVHHKLGIRPLYYSVPAL